jgi:hypothetical protein
MPFASRLASVVVIAAAASPLAVRPATVQSPSPVARLAWLAGCWQQTGRNGQVVDEEWMAPRAGLMVGMGRTVRGDSVIEYEHLRIFSRAGHAIYHAEPSGQTPAEFSARSVTDTLVLFENPQHDFPQRIIYRRRGSDSLLARVEGSMNGRARGFDFPYARVRCGGG